MFNITRHDPFSLSRTDPFTDIDELLKGFFVRPVTYEGHPPMQIKMDVKENDNVYIVHADLPDVKKDDIHVSIEGNQVSISAEARQEKEEKEGDKVVRTERYRGTVARRFTLAQDVDESTAEAKYSDGVLELTLPKKASNMGKVLSVQ